MAERLRVEPTASGPVLQAWVRDRDGMGWHWDWLQTLSVAEASAWEAALSSNTEKS